MSSSYRRAERADIPVAADIFVTSLTALAKNHGLPSPTAPRAPLESLYSHLFESGIFEVVENAGKVVGFAAGIVRGEIWFLSMFWVLPEHKLSGLGQPLLDRVWQRAESAGAKVFATWSSIDFAAVSIYLKRGLMPAGPIFTFAGPVLRAAAPDPRIELRPLAPAEAGEIDRRVRGTDRRADHDYWLAEGHEGFLVVRGGHTLGYFWEHEGTIGPAAWLEEEAGNAVIVAALAHAQSRAPQVKLIALGLNHTAIRAAIDAGLRLISSSHFLRSAPFGELEKYLPSGPALF